MFQHRLALENTSNVDTDEEDRYNKRNAKSKEKSCDKRDVDGGHDAVGTAVGSQGSKEGHRLWKSEPSKCNTSDKQWYGRCYKAHGISALMLTQSRHDEGPNLI